ncbi:hypothetical protein EDM22_08470 [Agromyces tardus]|uniref:DUF4386 family protein n=1 Tax=Agromyces tardus TaxID=2583849 RepID=A0A3M8AG36_9MICO|nr:hypothetical protein [Agromyces tardus]RNB50119.1 hypothetical protein EDM22_08470 [Agromyces tardus]
MNRDRIDRRGGTGIPERIGPGPWARAALWLLPLHAGLLAVSTITHQPDPASDFGGYADYVTSPLFLAGHLVASIVGAALGILGADAALAHLVGGRGRRRAVSGTALFTVGNVLLTSIFAAAAFAQPAIGRAWLAGHESVARAVNDDVYGLPLIGTAIAGLILFMSGAALLGAGIAATPALRIPGTTYAIAVPVAAVAGFAMPVLQPVAAAVAAVAAVVVALRLPRSTAGERRRVGGASRAAD